MGDIKLNIPTEVADLLGKTPEEVERSVREIIVLSLYRQHEISSGRAAELLGMDLLAFIRWSGEQEIPLSDMTPEESQQAVRTLESMERPDSRS